MAVTKQKAKAARSSVKKTAKKTVKKTARKAAAAKVQAGVIAHTEFASSDPAATKAWAQKSFGWKFNPPMPSPAGDYHMWDAGNKSGGGIRNALGPEAPGTIVYVEVADIKRAYAKALQNGGKAMMPPEAIGGGMGSMAVVTAPGGVAVGLWSQK